MRQFLDAANERKEIALEYFADVSDSLYLTRWEQVERLARMHFWSDETLKERFGYDARPGMQTGLHLIIVHVHRINLPHLLKPSPDYEGCKSWIEVPASWDRDISHPVVAGEEFATRRSQILAAIR